MARDPYQVLGLPRGASAAEVKRAYRRLAKQHHPDSAGEKALPRFLEIQGAYEALTAVIRRPPPRTPRPAEPWRADPARADGARPGGPRRASSGPFGATGSSATGSSRTGGAKGRPGSGSATGSAGGSSAGPRRRSSKKATFGSTTYGEAPESADPEWQGAAWYGQGSGEYWTINPREYADPRKHGPEYQARAAAERVRRAASERSGATDAATGAAAGAPEAATADASEARAREAAAARARRAASARAHEAGPEPGLPPLSLGLDLGRFRGFANRRWIVALAAWPPIGIAAAAAIGEGTGCASFAVTCTPAASLYPWIAQAAIVAALLVAPPVARLLVGGTAAVAVSAFPIAAALSASGATYDPVHGPPSLIGSLAITWLIGVGLMAVRTLRGPRITG